MIYKRNCVQTLQEIFQTMKDSRKNKSCVVPFYCKAECVFLLTYHFPLLCLLHHWTRSQECGRGVLSCFQGRISLCIGKERPSVIEWALRVIQNKKLVHMPSLPSLLLWSAYFTVLASCSCGNVDHLPPGSSVCKTDSPASEQKTDIKWVVLTLLSRHGSSPSCWDPH